MISASVKIDVPFFDVDAYRVVWHGNYARYLEMARCQLLQDIGICYDQMEEAGYFFPVVDMHIKYVKPLVFKQKINVEARLVAWEHKLVIHYIVCDAGTGERLTKAHTHQVAVSMPEQITQFQLPSCITQVIEARRSATGQNA